MAVTVDSLNDAAECSAGDSAGKDIAFESVAESAFAVPITRWSWRRLVVNWWVRNKGIGEAERCALDKLVDEMLGLNSEGVWTIVLLSEELWHLILPAAPCYRPCGPIHENDPTAVRDKGSDRQ